MQSSTSSSSNPDQRVPSVSIQNIIIPPNIAPRLAQNPNNLPRVAENKIQPFMRRSLGNGTFGIVYEMTDPSHPGEMLVYKRFREDTVNARSAWRQIQTEIETLSTLFHPNIVKITTVVYTLQLGNIGYIMEKADQSLCHYIMNYRSQTPRPTRVEQRIANKIAYGIICGLHFLHSTAKIKHGDLNPNNILIKDDFDVLISDFGTASDSEENSREHAGTNPFRNREQYLHQEWDSSADIHSFGMTLYFVCDMKIPFEERRNPTLPRGQEYQEACKLLYGLVDGIQWRPPINDARFGILRELVEGCWDSANRWTTEHAKIVVDGWIANRLLPM